MKHPRIILSILSLSIIGLTIAPPRVYAGSAMQWCWMLPGAKIKMLRSWLGGTMDALVSKWGPPDSSFNLSNGGHSLAYDVDCHIGYKIIFNISPDNRVIDCSYDSHRCKTEGK